MFNKLHSKDNLFNTIANWITDKENQPENSEPAQEPQT